MVKDIELSNARRLSIFIREEHPELLLEISKKIVDKLVLRLNMNQREFREVKAVWIFSLMFCVITRDLWLFKRINKDSDHARILFGNALEFVSNVNADKVIKPALAKQFIEFYSKNRNYLTISNAIVGQTIVESWILHEQYLAYLASIDIIAGSYITKEILNG